MIRSGKVIVSKMMTMSSLIPVTHVKTQVQLRAPVLERWKQEDPWKLQINEASRTRVFYLQAEMISSPKKSIRMEHNGPTSLIQAPQWLLI